MQLPSIVVRWILTPDGTWQSLHNHGRIQRDSPPPPTTTWKKRRGGGGGGGAILVRLPWRITMKNIVWLLILQYCINSTKYSRKFAKIIELYFVVFTAMWGWTCSFKSSRSSETLFIWVQPLSVQRQYLFGDRPVCYDTSLLKKMDFVLLLIKTLHFTTYSTYVPTMLK